MGTLNSAQVAAGPRAGLGYVEEVSYGNIPTSPTLKVCRRRSTTIGLTKDAYTSEEIRGDRMVSDMRHGIRRAGGDVVTELSPLSHADFMEALLGSYWELPVALDISVVNLTATANTTTGLIDVTASDFDFILLDMFIGATVTFTSTGTTALNGVMYTVVSHAANKISILPPDDLSWSSPASLTTGTFHIMGARLEMKNVDRSFTFERAFNDIGSFLTFTGMRVNSMAVDLPATGIATATYNFVGKNASAIASASIDGASEVVLDDGDLTSLTFDGSAGTITAGGGSFLTAGINPGDVLQFSGTGITDAQNREQKTVVAVTATVLTIAEAIQTAAAYTGTFEVLRVGTSDYTEVSDESVLVAVAGLLLVNGTAAGTVTAMNFTVNNQLGGSEVVGQNYVPKTLFGNQCQITGNITVLFDRGGTGETMYNAFDVETDVSMVMRLDKADGTDSLSFAFPRCKLSQGDIGDAVATGLPVTMGFTALKPLDDNPGQGSSQIYVYDSQIATGVAPPADDLVLTFVSEASGVATFNVVGGVPPYFLDADNGGGSTDKTVYQDGQFTFDYVSNGDYDPVLTDSQAVPDSSTVSITIATGS